MRHTVEITGTFIFNLLYFCFPDADDFEPDKIGARLASDKWDGEDEDDDTKDAWDKDEEEANENDDPDAVKGKEEEILDHRWLKAEVLLHL